MKFVSLLLFFLAYGYASTCTAQKNYLIPNDSAGIYKTFSDFQEGHLQHRIPIHARQYTIWPQGFFAHKDIEISMPDSTVILPIQDMWGYVDHKGRLIRISGQKHFKVLCDKGIVIYITYSPTKVAYYFSETLNTRIHRLTKKELLTVSEYNPLLCQRIRNTRKKHFLVWNDKDQMYFINRMFELDYLSLKSLPWR